ncbi:hypothetical protein KY290_017773 [Solanum tuberosum]|uniref:Uncharacterized protein n=1 Tax=Solanum tuberosum TaxID=4113 RepID=A0ABQ7VC92_SOLTU|nr:hypothetical protein KY290_017773 [Solanum tuberosum]
MLDREGTSLSDKCLSVSPSARAHFLAFLQKQFPILAAGIGQIRGKEPIKERSDALNESHPLSLSKGMVERLEKVDNPSVKT